MNISIWEGVWATIWMVLTTGAFQIGFAQKEIGATPFVLGLMAGLPAAANLLQIPASLYVERRGERRRFVAYTALIGRLLWIPILLLPFFVPPAVRLPLFLLLLTLSAASLSLSVPAWTSWMSDLVPETMRGEYFARRNQVAGLVAMLIPLPAGAFLDLAAKYGYFPAHWGFAALFGVACIAAVGAFLMIRRQPEPPMHRPEGEPAPLLQSLALPFGDPLFRPFLLFSAGTTFGLGLAAQFFVAWQVGAKGLNHPYLVVQLLGVLASLGGLLTTPLWGYLSDKFGSRPVLMIATLATIISPVTWVFTRPDAFWLSVVLISITNLVAGTAWAGVGLSQFNLLLSMSPNANRNTYVAVYSAMNGIVGGIAPILGGLLITAFTPIQFSLGLVEINNYKMLFLLTGLIRFGCALLLTRVPTQDSAPTRSVWEQLVAAPPIASYYMARKLRQPASEEARQKTIAELTALRSPLAVEELTYALNDISPEVREQAVAALATIKSSRAVPALGEKLRDPSAGIGEAAAQALSDIGSPAAVPYLLEAIGGPDATVRVAAIKALRNLVDGSHLDGALPVLRQALTPNHPATCEAACYTLTGLTPRLSRTQIIEALPALLPLLQPDVDRGMRFSAARTLAAWGKRLDDVLRPGDDVLPSLLGMISDIESCLLSEEDPAVLAQETLALSRLYRLCATVSMAMWERLLPTLDRTAPVPLASKQTLSALADLILPPGLFYPYLSMSETDRDDAANRLLKEMGEFLRRGKGKSRPASADTASLVEDALEAFTTGQYLRLHELLDQLASPDAPPATPESITRHTVRQRLRDRAESGHATPEESLLALLLARYSGGSLPY
ncbi:MAG: hypothetical protein OHK0029_09160 [Armatimonadaceae bacterium]